MNIRIGFSTTNSLHSRLIRWFTKAQVSHTYIRLHDEFLGAELILHADWPGVIIEHAEEFDKKNMKIEEFEIDDERIDESIKENLRHLGKKYDYYRLFGWAWTIAFSRWIKKKIRKPADNPKKLICVDFCIRVLNKAKITHLPLGQMHPKLLRKWFHDHYEEMNWQKHSFYDCLTIIDNVKAVILK